MPHHPTAHHLRSRRKMKEPEVTENDPVTLQRENELLKDQLGAIQTQMEELKRQHYTSRFASFQKSKHLKNWWKNQKQRGRSPAPDKDPIGVRTEQMELSTIELVDVEVAGPAGLHHRHTHHDQGRAPPIPPSSPPRTIKSKCSDVDLGERGDGVEAESLLSASSSDRPMDHEDWQGRSFLADVSDRAGWLVGLLIMQSCSSFILRGHKDLLQAHSVLVEYLTMLVGSGGNAGNQASVRVIRGLATGDITSDNVRSYLMTELKMGVCLSLLLALTGCLRAAVFMTPFLETLAITVSLLAIVMTSVVLGAALPLVMYHVGIDPAHSSTSIQVIMDITGVSITVAVSSFILDSALSTLRNENSSG